MCDKSDRTLFVFKNPTALCDFLSHENSKRNVSMPRKNNDKRNKPKSKGVKKHLTPQQTKTLAELLDVAMEHNLKRFLETQAKQKRRILKKLSETGIPEQLYDDIAEELETTSKIFDRVSDGAGNGNGNARETAFTTELNGDDDTICHVREFLEGEGCKIINV
jgi:hypothetical protein